MITTSLQMYSVSELWFKKYELSKKHENSTDLI